MKDWLKQTTDRQRELLSLVSKQTGLPAMAIEKDWWVTLALKAIFETKWADNIVFKGGTSLSKSWGLIERFSEDIDLVIDRSILGYGEELSKNKISQLRKDSCSFTSGPFKQELEARLIKLGIPAGSFTLEVMDTSQSDRDPQILAIDYTSVFDKDSYLKEAVLIEIGARSLREPSEMRTINSIISETLGERSPAGTAFSILTVVPARTFLEKIFLLHEEFSKNGEKTRTDRMSRHLYDLDRIMDTEHGIMALDDLDLYSAIVDHRKKFNAIRGISYEYHIPSRINFIPPIEIRKAWEEDYKAMQASMIYGESKSFDLLIERMEVLLKRFRSKNMEIKST